MGDTEEPLQGGTTDSIKPWTIKAVASEVRDLAIMAARREGLTTGQWLERVIRQAVADGDSRAPRTGKEVAIVPTSPPATPSAEPDFRELVRLAREVTPEGKDSEAMKEARRQINQRLKSLRASKGGLVCPSV
jgi:hypothetical protein